MAVNVETGTTRARGGRADSLGTRLATETKHAVKTTEFWAFLAVAAGILIASALIGADDNAGRGANAGDYFTANDAWKYIAWLTIGYMVARGLAKAGSREPYWQGGTNAERDD
jgi:hypothetical protein